MNTNLIKKLFIEFIKKDLPVPTWYNAVKAAVKSERILSMREFQQMSHRMKLSMVVEYFASKMMQFIEELMDKDVINSEEDYALARGIAAEVIMVIILAHAPEKDATKLMGMLSDAYKKEVIQQLVPTLFFDRIEISCDKCIEQPKCAPKKVNPNSPSCKVITEIGNVMGGSHDTNCIITEDQATELQKIWRQYQKTNTENMAMMFGRGQEIVN
ncbi:MAG: hypothetical protein FWF34_01535 [Alphaproteobacteria bacterium]|nr:hypothetical protein [Alphaproteobacteria bacterium]MCL2889920.1 hypothetical protein [Alphaproteobacteria bacterium]